MSSTAGTQSPGDATSAGVIVTHPNRDKPVVQATRATVVLLLLASAALVLIVTIGGWSVLQGAVPVQIAYVIVYVTLAFYAMRWNRGNHSLKFGVEYREYIAPQQFTQRKRGDYIYNTTQVFLEDISPDNFGERSTGALNYYGNQKAIYWYANDSWRLNPHLNLNLGVSYGYIATLRVFQAAGLAFLFIPINTLSYTGIPMTKNNDVSGLTNLARNIGGSVGTAYVVTMLARRQQFHQNRLGSWIAQSSGNLLSSLGIGSRPRPATTSTVTTGVRGFSEEDLANAKPNAAEVEKMKSYAATGEDAAKLAESGKLAARLVAYFDENGKALKETK